MRLHKCSCYTSKALWLMQSLLTHRKNNFHTMVNRQGVDFGEWDKDFNPTSWLKPACDLLKDNGSMIIFCGFRQLSTIVGALEELGCEVKDQGFWMKSNPMPRNIERRYVGGLENFICAVKPRPSGRGYKARQT